jgi:hypothetical protein
MFSTRGISTGGHAWVVITKFEYIKKLMKDRYLILKIGD